ncbi:MAG: glycosyltransferase [Chloroflexota bacterium]
MKVLMISKALVVGTYQKKLEELAKFDDIDLTVVVPPHWGELDLEKAYLDGYRLIVSPIAFNGWFHIHYYPRLKHILRQGEFDVVHIDEEPYNLATFQAMRLARKFGAKTVVFSWQNILRKYPPPFSFMERYVLNRADALLVGNEEAQEVWTSKGYAGVMRQIPQFGIDPGTFYRRERVNRVSRPSVILQRSARRTSRPSLTIGYAGGRIVREKGIDILIQAAAKLNGPWDLKILGSGPDQGRLEKMSQRLGINARVKFDERLPSMLLPNYLSSLDVLVLSSITRPNWKEQFGRILIEAMACEVVTVGARSGAIPEVIGEAGLLFDEGDIDGLAEQLQRLLDDVELRQSLVEAAKTRVHTHYTHAVITQQTVDVYRQIYVPSASNTPLDSA